MYTLFKTQYSVVKDRFPQWDSRAVNYTRFPGKSQGLIWEKMKYIRPGRHLHSVKGLTGDTEKETGPRRAGGVAMGTGGEYRIRTGDIQLAKLALYQLS